MRTFIIISLLSLAACGNYKTPAMSDPHKMSADTLCYRYAYAKSDPELKSEVQARGLDCREVLDAQRPVGESRW